MRSLLLMVAAGTLTLGMALGCAPREHLRKDYGRLTHARFAKQQVYLEAAKGNPEGLDSEEAAAIHANYNKQLTGGETPSKEQQVLILENPKKQK